MNVYQTSLSEMDGDSTLHPEATLPLVSSFHGNLFT